MRTVVAIMAAVSRRGGAGRFAPRQPATRRSGDNQASTGGFDRIRRFMSHDTRCPQEH